MNPIDPLPNPPNQINPALSDAHTLPSDPDNLTKPNLSNPTQSKNPIDFSLNPPNQTDPTPSNAHPPSCDSQTQNLNHINLACVSQPFPSTCPKVTYAEQLLHLDPDNNTLSLPDMNIVLRHFGIEPSNLKVVPLKDYIWENSNENPGSQTISQRIRTLVRDARHKKL